MIIDGMALWGVQGLSQKQVLDRINAVPDMIAALEAVLNASGTDDDELEAIADKINYALTKAGV